MVARTRKPCRNCKRNLTRDRSGLCENCLPEHGTNWKAWQERKGNRHQRGYGSNWEKLRRIVLERDEHLCLSCVAAGIYTQGTHVDHIKPKAQGGDDSMDNLQTLCKTCHEAKTARE
ncbi:HNH endonuclease [Aliidiomarina sp. Khilg15.8]